MSDVPSNPGPGDGPTAPVPASLSPELRADEAMRVVLLRLLRAIEANVDGTLRRLDPEHLHQLRVAIRRTRAALGEVGQVFPAGITEHYRAEFKWIGGATGPARDLDVFLLKFDAITSGITSEDHDILLILKDFITEERAEVQAPMAAALESRRFAALLDGWRGFLQSPVPIHPEASAATAPVAKLSARRIRKCYRRILKRGRRLGEDAPAPALHRIRLDAKKLRYLLEMFRSLYPPAEMASLVRELKRLQDNLGDFNDFAVQQESVARYAEELRAQGRGTPAVSLATERLLAALAAGQERERRAFHDRFDRFASEANRDLFEELFGPRR